MRVGGVRVVRRYVRKRTFSTADRVLIHMSTDALRPEERTQEGIADATRSGRSTLTKWLKRMEHRGLLVRDRVRLPDHPLPKYAYRLSEEGWSTAAELRSRLGSDVVMVRAPNVGELGVRVADLPSLAPSRLDLTLAVASVRKGRLDLGRTARGTRSPGRILWGSGLRRVDRFFGRSRELEALDTWWAVGPPALLVTGMAGIGKSSLAAAWAQSRRSGAPVYGFEIHRASTAAGLLSDFSAFLAALGKPSLAAHLAQGVPLDTSFVARLVERDLAGQRLLAVLDNVDQGSRELARAVETVFLETEGREGFRVILLGRVVPRWLQSRCRDAGRMERRQLQGLDAAGARDLLRHRGVPPESSLAEEIIRRTRGHPLLLHLSAPAGSGRASQVRSYLKDEVWNSLAAKDRTVLEAASILRGAASGRILERVAGADRRTLESLADRNLLERTVADGFAVHDLIREFVVGQLPGYRARRLHARAADALLQSTDSRARWEGLYHLLNAGRVDEAAGLLDAEGARLLDSVAAEEVATLVRGIAVDESDPGTYHVFAEILGDSLTIRGHWGPAFFQYDHARRLAEGSGQLGRIPRLLRKMAYLERCRNRYSHALGLLVEAQARLARTDNAPETTEVLRELALVEQALGNLSEASQHLTEAIDLAAEGPERDPLSRALLALGSLEIRRGHLEQGLQSCLEGLRTAERSGSLTEVAHAHIVVGTALEDVGRLAEGLEHHETGLRISRLLGNLRLTAYATLNLTGTLISLGRLRDASVVLREAQDHFTVLEERDTLAILKTYEAHLEMGLGHVTRARNAWEEGVKELRRVGGPVELAMALKEAGEFYIESGHAGAGRDSLMEARDLARRMRNAKLVSEIEIALGKLAASFRPSVQPSSAASG